MEFTKCQMLIYLPLLILSAATTLFIFRPEFFAVAEFEDSLIMDKLISLENEAAPLVWQKVSDKVYISEDCQPVLTDPPEIIKAVYLTSWSAATKKKIDYLIDLAKTTEINAVVIDIKDYSGQIFYDTAVPQAEKYGAETIRIRNIDPLIERLHKEGIYLIARVTVFQDPILAQARPELAVQSQAKLIGSTSSDLLWLDNKGLAWIDAAAKESWYYNIAIAQDAACRGFDEINFDYIRFPSDGDLEDMVFSFWQEETTKRSVMKEFFTYLRQEMGEVKISADLFGLTAVSSGDLGIGQVLEDSFGNFDYICPMVYPSHYADGFLGYQNPAEHPYEIIKDSMDIASERLRNFNQTNTSTQSFLRPWIQDFDLGAEYDAEMVRAEIQAVVDATNKDYRGFMLWSPRNIYTRGGLEEN